MATRSGGRPPIPALSLWCRRSRGVPCMRTALRGAFGPQVRGGVPECAPWDARFVGQKGVACPCGAAFGGCPAPKGTFDAQTRGIPSRTWGPNVPRRREDSCGCAQGARTSCREAVAGAPSCRGVPATVSRYPWALRLRLGFPLTRKADGQMSWQGHRSHAGCCAVQSSRPK